MPLPYHHYLFSQTQHIHIINPGISEMRRCIQRTTPQPHRYNVFVCATWMTDYIQRKSQAAREQNKNKAKKNWAEKQVKSDEALNAALSVKWHGSDWMSFGVILYPSIAYTINTFVSHTRVSVCVHVMMPLLQHVSGMQTRIAACVCVWCIYTEHRAYTTNTPPEHWAWCWWCFNELHFE